MTLDDLPTPELLLDHPRLLRNIQRLRTRLDGSGVAFRPHLKTVKCVPIARLMMSQPAGPATVSTLQEAEEFAAAGVTDLLYAVGIAPQKLPRVEDLLRRGVDLAVILDSEAQAHAVVNASHTTPIPVLIEIDTDGHRAGLHPEDPRLLDVGRILHLGGATLRGVMTHAGGSYGAVGEAALASIAEAERSGAVRAAERLRAAGLPSPVVSIGSTPTAFFAQSFAGVTEVRAGVYAFFDLVMAGLGVCKIEDIALSVLATVIGRQRNTGLLIIDAGWMALSADRGTAKQSVDQGFGLVCKMDGTPYPDLTVVQANQEHGLLGLRSGSTADMPDLEIGSRVRILPNHACATASQYPAYSVLQGAAVIARWPRVQSGW